MSKVIVAGAGHGGVVAAIKLAQEGFKVTILEKSKKGQVGLPQTDAFSESTFNDIELPAPPNFKKGKNILTFVPKDEELSSLTLPPPENESFLVDRKELIAYLLGLAEESGVEILYEKEVQGPIILGNRVCGVATESEEYYCDLVIDALGVMSNLRTKLPRYFNVDREIMPYDILYTYRGYFNIIKDAPPPKHNYTIYVRDNGTVGFTWLITEKDRADALIARFYKPTDDEILELLMKIHEENHHMGKDLVYGGSHSIIPVCQPLAVLVANGYAAVGDSAFMAYPTKGSGIANSMMAGYFLSNTVISDENHSFDCESLWEYEKTFFKEIGFDSCKIALFKNMLPYLSSEEVNELFREELFTTEELQKLTSDPLGTLLTSKGVSAVKEKLKLLKENNLISDTFKNLAIWLAKFKVLEATFPSKYDKDDIKKWNEKYNEFFNSIRYKEELLLTE